MFSLDPLSLTIAWIAFNPIFWNSAAQLELHTKLISRVTGKKLGCYLLALTIFLLGLGRDAVYHSLLTSQPIDLNNFEIPGLLLLGIGNILVLSSMWKLGVEGTYLGDYFGLLQAHRVTSFPFNVVDNPMYVGSTLSFLGTALWMGRSIGIWLSLEVGVMYFFAMKFEGPFTERIYRKRQ